MPVRKAAETRRTILKPAARAAAAAAPRRVAPGGLTLVLGFVLVLVGIWAGGATYLLLSGNRLATSAIGRAFELQDYYEQQGAEFRRLLAASQAEYERAQRDLDRLEKIANQQTGIEARLIELVRRQGQIESRQSALVRVAEQIGGAPIAALQGVAAKVPAPPRRQGAGLERTRSALGMEPDDPEDFELDPDAELRSDPASERRGDAGSDALGERRAARVPVLEAEKSLEIAMSLLVRAQTLEANQITSMKTLSEAAEFRLALLRQAAEAAGRELSDIVDPKRIQALRAVSKVARPAAEDASPFGIALSNLRRSATEIRRLAPVVNGLPIRQPVTAENRISSRFGARSDPFLGTTRFHAGQDFAAATGTPIFSTGAGVVLSAGEAGGYGNLVQIDHGNGLVTRYAHLSEIHVSPGQPIAAGQMVGKAGSTGRSTGPHLHYETRLNNVPNDPMRLMRVGAQLGVAVAAPLPPQRPARRG
ncbi:M23 family metallopeptidase [Rhabdaerophilum calidifontis]|uniref:M23 family metallopeptidase n=1 Tax=Rhabdaerophilum calidifontis TaxID=2604328 RepID=UPI00123C6352|nr:M23 family metallopeptidase [Rhabdaerophilum calidifontis]